MPAVHARRDSAQTPLVHRHLVPSTSTAVQVVSVVPSVEAAVSAYLAPLLAAVPLVK